MAELPCFILKTRSGRGQVAPGRSNGALFEVEGRGAERQRGVSLVLGARPGPARPQAEIVPPGPGCGRNDSGARPRAPRVAPSVQLNSVAAYQVRA
jgi:hypothetical protein